MKLSRGSRNGTVGLLVLTLTGRKSCRTIAGYPDRLDGESVRVDFHQRGATCRWLWLGWPVATRAVAADVADDWQALADPDANLEFAVARASLTASRDRLPFTRPAFMLADRPVARRWWYRRLVSMPATGHGWLRLPRLMFNARLWVDQAEIDLAPYQRVAELLAPQVPLSARPPGHDLEIVVRCDCGISQYGAQDHGGTGFEGRPAVLVPAAADSLVAAQYHDRRVTVASRAQRWEVPHSLLETP